PIDNKIMIKVGDNITTDHIMPAGNKALPYRSNIEKISEFCFGTIDEKFHDRCLEHKNGIIIAGENYGQGSSREHAAIAPMYLGIEAIVAKSYARIHKQNLINNGIIPFMFICNEDYDRLSLLDELEFVDVENISVGKDVKVINHTQGYEFAIRHDLNTEQIEMIKTGGLLNMIKEGK
ncbi:MAG: hypothetical protein PUC68_07520, partial [Firmicutes bacterium]|nr:hypothetical protein [Bacillota bacterium]